MKKAKYFLPTFFFICNFCWSQIPAFPGAEGFGANTIGGRGGKVIKVTNLNDHGPGSLRAAIETNEPRIIVFDVGGIIDLETALSIVNPFVTIAGQTAPGDGICIRGERVWIQTHDVVMRHLRIRPGDINFGPPNDWITIDAITINGHAYNVIIDHCSLSWSIDEIVEVWQHAHDITIQNCIISEALNLSKHPAGVVHSMGMIIGSKANNISIHHNIFAHNNDRNPHIKGDNFVDFRNNVIYNPGGVATDIAAKNNQIVNYINNYVIKGPRTKIPAEIIVRSLKNNSTKIYSSGNIGIKKEFRIGYTNDGEWVSPLNPGKDSAQINNTKLFRAHPAPVVTTFTAEQTLDYALEEAGATLPKRDAVDREVIKDIINKEDGFVNTKNNLLAWPPYEKGLPFLDTDEDGMPDHWEDRYGLDLEFDDNRNDPDGDGYTNIEEYINGTDPAYKGKDQTFTVNPLSSSTKNNLDYPQLDFNIELNYPNPFDEFTNIKFSVDHPANIAIKVFNIDGKEVAELANDFLYEGKYHIIWDARGVDPGIYQIVMASKNQVKSIKTILSR